MIAFIAIAIAFVVDMKLSGDGNYSHTAAEYAWMYGSKRLVLLRGMFIASVAGLVVGLVGTLRSESKAWIWMWLNIFAALLSRPAII